jgi:hypothetical protein
MIKNKNIIEGVSEAVIFQHYINESSETSYHEGYTRFEGEREVDYSVVIWDKSQFCDKENEIIQKYVDNEQIELI